VVGDERREREDKTAIERNRAKRRGRYDEKDEEEGAATPGAILLEFK